MEPVYRWIDSRVADRVSRDWLEQLKDGTADAPLVPKYDPEDFHEDGLSDDEIESVVDSSMVEAVQIGGSGDDVTEQNMEETVRTLDRLHDGILMVEPGKQEDIGGGSLNGDIVRTPDIFNKPGVWNTENSEWINGHRRKAQSKINEYIEEKAENELYEKVRDELSGIPFISDERAERISSGYIDWLEDPEAHVKQEFDSGTISEIYYILNPESTAAEVTGADGDLDGRDRYDIESDVSAMVADLAQDGYRGIIYLEGSGALTPPSIVQNARREIEHRGISDDVLLAYGGGVGTENILDLEYDTAIESMDTLGQLEEYQKSGADIVIVGNSIQENGEDALR